MHQYCIFSINISEGHLLLGARLFLDLRSCRKGLYMPTPRAIRGRREPFFTRAWLGLY